MVHLLAFPKLVLSRHLRIFGMREDWALLHTQSDKASPLPLNFLPWPPDARIVHCFKSLFSSFVF